MSSLLAGRRSCVRVNQLVLGECPQQEKSLINPGINRICNITILEGLPSLGEDIAMKGFNSRPWGEFFELNLACLEC